MCSGQQKCKLVARHTCHCTIPVLTTRPLDRAHSARITAFLTVDISVMFTLLLQVDKGPLMQCCHQLVMCPWSLTDVQAASLLKTNWGPWGFCRACLASSALIRWAFGEHSIAKPLHSGIFAIVLPSNLWSSEQAWLSSLPCVCSISPSPVLTPRKVHQPFLFSSVLLASKKLIGASSVT